MHRAQTCSPSWGRSFGCPDAEREIRRLESASSAFTVSLGPATRLIVEVQSPTVQHIVTVQQLRKWAETESGSPAETVQKKRAAKAIGT